MKKFFAPAVLLLAITFPHSTMAVDWHGPNLPQHYGCEQHYGYRPPRCHTGYHWVRIGYELRPLTYDAWGVVYSAVPVWELRRVTYCRR